MLRPADVLHAAHRPRRHRVCSPIPNPNPLCALLVRPTSHADQHPRGSAAETGSPFFVWEWSVGPLLVPNESSEARDHCANERSRLHPPCRRHVMSTPAFASMGRAAC